MRSYIIGGIGALTVLALVFAFQNKGDILWSKNQLMQPADLAKLIGTPNAPVIFDIGPAGKIKGAIYIGPVKDDEGIAALKAQLSKLSKTTAIVVYCGCCPYEHCPNIRPAYKLLTEMGFTDAKLLDMPHNLKTDWIDKGYAVE
jgi:hypothetical protein